MNGIPVVTPSEIELYVCHGNYCALLTLLDGKSGQRSPVPDLECDHEEADTRMFFCMLSTSLSPPDHRE